ncbi:MAG: hypothetical protein J6Y22_07805 [Paludibacteraceae bacterium]|nr:hypothetical protein [Paludibacteraceae bacterium]
MKPLSFCLIMLLFSIGNALWAQPKEMDYHEVLNVGRVSVAPDGTVWHLPDRGTTFHKMSSSDSLWRAFTPMVRTDNGLVEISQFGMARPEILFYDDTTVLLINGFIFKDTLSYYRSTDNGHTWTRFQLPVAHEIIGSIWSCDGRIWIFLTFGHLYYSEDGGITFSYLSDALSKYRRSNIAEELFMADAKYGMLSSGYGDIFITDDGWKSARRIDDPVKQGLIPDGNIFWLTCRVQSWNRYLFASARGRVCYAEMADSIQWQLFPARSFLVDKARNELVFIMNNGSILRTSDMAHYDTVGHLPEAYDFDIISVVQDKIYCKDSHRIMVVSDTGIREFGYYTDEPIKINKDDRIRVAGQLFSFDWNILYCFDKTRKQWYRTYPPLGQITNITTYGTETDTILLSDGNLYYRYAIRDGSILPFRYEHPLEVFLQSPVETVRITASQSGCGGGRKQEVEYCREGGLFTTLKMTQSATGLYFSEEERQKANADVSFHHSFPASKLDSLLRDLDEHYDLQISWRQFVVTTADLDSMQTVLSDESEHGYYRKDSASMRWVRDTLSLISDSLLTSIVMSPFNGYCTTQSTLKIQFTNSDGKTLLLECHDPTCSTGTVPYMLPLKLNVKGNIVYSSHIPFMQFASSLMPDGMVTKEKFTIHELLCKVGRVLSEER